MALQSRNRANKTEKDSETEYGKFYGFDTLTFDQVIERNLKVMDMTAFAMCRDNNIALHVFNMDVAGNLEKVIDGANIGTMVNNKLN